MIHYAGARPGGTRAHPSHDKAEPFRGIHFAASIAFLTVTLILTPARVCAVEITRVGQWANQRLGSVYQIAIVGNYAYATTDSALQVFDITSPTNLLPVAGARFVPSQIALSGDYAYLTGRGGFQILSITNPLAPICIGGTTNLGSSVSSIAVSGNFAYLAESPYSSTPPYAATMHIIDVHDPANPVRVGGTSVAGSVRSISVSGSYAAWVLIKICG